MRELLDQQEAEGGTDEIFAEVENDVEFEGGDGTCRADADESDVVDSDFDSESEEEKSEEDVEAEQTLAREERRERKAARPRAVPLHALRPAMGQPAPARRRAERTERAPRPAPAPTPTPGVVRSSSRRATVQSKIKTQTKLQEAEERRASVRARPARKRTKFLTQDALISEALETEEENIQSLHHFLEQEEERKARQRASGKKEIQGPFLRWVSVGLSQSVFAIRAQQREAEARAAAAARAAEAERARVEAERVEAERAERAEAERNEEQHEGDKRGGDERGGAERGEVPRDEAERDGAQHDQARHDEAARDEAARDEAARNEAARAEAARDEAAHDEAARDEAARDEASRPDGERQDPTPGPQGPGSERSAAAGPAASPLARASPNERVASSAPEPSTWTPAPAATPAGPPATSGTAPSVPGRADQPAAEAPGPLAPGPSAPGPSAPPTPAVIGADGARAATTPASPGGAPTLPSAAAPRAAPTPSPVQPEADADAASAPAPDAEPASEPIDHTITARTVLSLCNLEPGTSWPDEFRLLLGDHCEWDRLPVVPSRNRPFRPRQSTCVITGLPARYRDPRTGIAYATQEAFHTLHRVVHDGYLWTGSGARNVPLAAGCYVAHADDVGAAGVFAEARRARERR